MYQKMIIKLFTSMQNLVLVLILGTLSANTLSLEDTGDSIYNINYTSDEAMGGFQFNIAGADIISASGGEAQSNGFVVSTAGSMVLGFSFTGSTIPAGAGTLTILNLS